MGKSEFMTANFHEDLERSIEAHSLPFWKEIYKKAFPSMISMVSHEGEGWWQKAGIDRSIIFESGKTIKIDEKVRFKNRKTGKIYEDIAIEVWSDFENKKPGWISKPLDCDYIAYAIAPLGICHLFPTIQFQNAFRKNSESWMESYQKIDSQNNGYFTRSVCVPPSVIWPQIGKEFRVSFEALEEAL